MSATIAYGVRCTWWDDKDNVGSLQMPAMMQSPRGGGFIPNPGQRPTCLPCCPHCQSMLFETDKASWTAGVERQNAAEPGYADLIAFMQGKCFPDMQAAKAAFAKAGGA